MGSGFSAVFFITTIVFLILWIREKDINSQLRRGFRPPQNPYQNQYQNQYQAPHQGQAQNPYQSQSTVPPNMQTPPPVYQNMQPPPQNYQQGANPYYQNSNPQGANPYYQNGNQQGANPYAQGVSQQQPNQYYQGNSQGYYQQPPRRPVKTKEEANIRNLNIVLYVASFLVIAGAATLVSTTVDSITQLVILIIIFAIFYIPGIVLYKTVPKIKAAAIAFTGTGLAIIPFIGLSFYFLAQLPGPEAWVITSIIGLIANVIATIMMRSQVVSYFTIAFVLSLACSVVATVGVGIVWYFVVIIIVSIVCTVVTMLTSSAIPNVFSKAIMRTGQIATPSAIVASLFLIPFEGINLYSILFSLATIHYLLFLINTKKKYYEIIVRILCQISVVLIVADIIDFELNPFTGASNLWQDHVVCVCILITSILQVAFSCIKIYRGDRHLTYNKEIFWIHAMTLVILFATTTWYSVIPNSSSHRSIFCLISLCVIAGYYAYLATRYKKLIPTYITAALIIPIITVAVVSSLALKGVLLLVLPIIFLLLAILLLLYYRRNINTAGITPAARLFLNLFIPIYAATMIFTTIDIGSDIHNISHFILNGVSLLLGAAVVFALSALEKRILYYIASVVLFIVGVGFLCAEVQVSSISLLIFEVVCLAVLGGLAFVFHTKLQFAKRNVNIIATASISLLFLTNLNNFSAHENSAPAIISIIVLAIASALLLLVSIRMDIKDVLFRIIVVVSCIIYGLLALAIAQATMPVTGLITGVIFTAIMFVLSRNQRIQLIDIAVSFGIISVVYEISQLAKFDSEYRMFISCVIAAVIFYVLYIGNMRHRPDDKFRIWYFFIIAECSLLVGAFSSNIFEVSQTHGVIAVSALLVAGGIAVLCGFMHKVAFFLKEVGLYLIAISIVLYLQLLFPYANIGIVYVHILAVAAFLSAFLLQTTNNARTARIVIALAIISLGVGVEAIMFGGVYQIIFLTEMIIILVIGALRLKQWAIWWGVVGVVLAVLYFLKSYVWLMLLFLGVALIAFVVWRLTKINRRR